MEIVKSRGRERENVRDGRMEPLPKQLLLLRERSFLVFVSNLPATISKAELEAMFCRAGKIVDIFIPVDHDSKESRGFAFARLTSREAEKAVDLAEGRSWGGRKIQANLARLHSKKKKVRSCSASLLRRKEETGVHAGKLRHSRRYPEEVAPRSEVEAWF